MLTTDVQSTLTCVDDRRLSYLPLRPRRTKGTATAAAAAAEEEEEGRERNRGRASLLIRHEHGACVKTDKLPCHPTQPGSVVCAVVEVEREDEVRSTKTFSVLLTPSSHQKRNEAAAATVNSLR